MSCQCIQYLYRNFDSLSWILILFSGIIFQSVTWRRHLWSQNCIGGLVNTNKCVHHYSSLISLLPDKSNSLQLPPLTFKTQINMICAIVGVIVSQGSNFAFILSLLKNLTALEIKIFFDFVLFSGRAERMPQQMKW